MCVCVAINHEREPFTIAEPIEIPLVVMGLQEAGGPDLPTGRVILGVTPAMAILSTLFARGRRQSMYST